MMNDDDVPGPPPGELIECRMCHQSVPAGQTITIGGRILCFGCAGAWFDDDEDEDND